MCSLKIQLGQLDVSSMPDNPSKKIWGRLYVDVDGYCFPNEEWYDVVSSIVDMWTMDVVDFIETKKAHCVLYFMDGPFEIHLINHLDNSLMLSCRNRDGEEFASTVIGTPEFLKSILDWVDTYLDAYRKNITACTNDRIYIRTVNSRNKLNHILSMMI